MRSTDAKQPTQDDAWSAFERAVDAAVKSGPKPMPKADKPKKEKPTQRRATSPSGDKP